MHWFLWLVWAAILVTILSAVGPTGLAIVWVFLSLSWPYFLGAFLSILCGSTATAAVLAADELWWRRAAFGLPALAGAALLAAWEPFTLWFAASGVGLAAWEHFKGLPSWMFDGERPPAS